MLTLPAYVVTCLFGWNLLHKKQHADAYITNASVENIHNAVQRKEKFYLIDVQKHTKRYSISKSIHLPLEVLTKTIESFVPDKHVPITVFCENGSRSYQAAKLLHYLGYTQVTDMVGGMITWKDAGFPAVLNKVSNNRIH